MAKRKPTARRGQGKRKPRTPAQFFAQPPRRQATAMKAAHVLAAMRKDRISLRRAAREEGIAPATVLRHAGNALRKTAEGTYKARKSDRLLRVLILPTPNGLAEIATLDSRAATIAGEYWNAVNDFLETGDETELARFRGVTITDAQGNTVPLLTDADELERLGAAGILSFQSMYARAS
jgi:hypothetical protein